MTSQDQVHVLVVEDDIAFRRMVVRMLERAGYHVVQADGFAGAMKIVEAPGRIDVMLTDIGMPKGTPHGLSIARVSRNKRSDLEIVFMTGGATEDLHRLTVGETILQKPFTEAALISAIEAVSR